MTNERITGQDNVITAITNLSDGNPGGLSVCMNAYKFSPAIDPIGALGGFAPLLALDTLGIYGSRIWMLYKDVCGENLPKFLASLRAWQLGFVSKETLYHAIDNCGKGLDLDADTKQVCKRIPEFNSEWKAA